jgi:hypothetical protein
MSEHLSARRRVVNRDQGNGAGADLVLLPAGTGPGRDLLCLQSCHSIRLATQQRLSRKRWNELLDWIWSRSRACRRCRTRTGRWRSGYLAEHLNPDVPR